MTTLHANPTAAAPSRRGELMRRIAQAARPIMVPLAGRRFFPLWGRIAYRGRRSGREFSIPIAIGVTPEHFFVPLPFANAQWFQNVLAAGGCTVRWGGRDFQGVEPTIVPAAEAIPAYGPIVRHLIPGVGIQRFLRLRRA